MHHSSFGSAQYGFDLTIEASLRRTQIMSIISVSTMGLVGLFYVWWRYAHHPVRFLDPRDDVKLSRAYVESVAEELESEDEKRRPTIEELKKEHVLFENNDGVTPMLDPLPEHPREFHEFREIWTSAEGDQGLLFPDGHVEDLPDDFEERAVEVERLQEDWYIRAGAAHPEEPRRGRRARHEYYVAGIIASHAREEFGLLDYTVANQMVLHHFCRDKIRELYPDMRIKDRVKQLPMAVALAFVPTPSNAHAVQLESTTGVLNAIDEYGSIWKNPLAWFRSGRRVQK